MTDAPFDAGLQAERTLLAWRRTCLSLAIAGLVLVRFEVESLGVAAIVGGLAGILLSGLAYLDAARRYRRVHAHLTSGRDLPSAAAPVTLAAAAVAVFALAGVAWVVVRAGSP